MYIDGILLNKFRERFGNYAGKNIALFFEEWRNYGQDWIMERYPERTFYYYISKLEKAGLMVKERKGTYKPAPGYENPVKP